MPIFWFLTGSVTTLAVLIWLMPLLRKLPRCSVLPVFGWRSTVAAVAIVAVFFGISLRAGHFATSSTSPTETSAPMARSEFGDAARVFSRETSPPVNDSGDASTVASGAVNTNAGPMNSAVANLESRLAKGGGSADDWELLAKSFEFMGRTADAAKARARQLPALSPAAASTDGAARGSDAADATRTVVSGELTLAAGLSGKAQPGETVFIVAKSVDAPGAPVAVLRTSVGSWPLKFTLDDSQSMIPGRNLSSAGRVTIEARISHKGQPLPAPGDLQGSSGVIDPTEPQTPAARQTLKILIDRVLT